MASQQQGRDRRRANGRRYSVQTQSAPDKLWEHHVTGATPTTQSQCKGVGTRTWLLSMAVDDETVLAKLACYQNFVVLYTTGYIQRF